MPTFRVRLAGRSFEKLHEGQSALMGFYTNCFVDADDVASAEAAAITAVSARPDLREQLDRPGSTATVVVEESSEWTEPTPEVRMQGLAWYPLD